MLIMKSSSVTIILFLSILVCGAVRANDEQFYEFNLTLDTVFPDPINMSARVLDAPAGKHGRVKANGDALVFEDGTPARFWGVGMTFSGSLPPKFPPDKKTSDKIVKRLASQGVNHIRFVGFDNSAPEPFRNWMSDGNISGETIDRFDYFISKLKAAGVYYSLSIINNVPVLLDAVKDVPPNTAARSELRKYRNVKLYHPKSVEFITEWYSAFFSRKNKYTGLSYAEDPANIYVSAVNEDSIFDAYYSGFKQVDKFYMSLLNEKFNKYLLDKYKSNNKLRDAWGKENNTIGDESLDKRNIKLLTYKNRFASSPYRDRDTIKFLMKIDYEFYKNMKEMLRNVGYDGLFSGTNNWYGYANLYVNDLVGDYIDVHGYFDHPKYKKGYLPYESIGNYSYLNSRPGKSGDIEIDLIKNYTFPLYRSFSAAIYNKPLIFSEWNHSAWSDYSYEGPLMMAAYSSLQGYPALNVHTYFNHPNPDPYENITKKALSVTGNTLLNALMPSLSLAFIKGYISESLEYDVVSYGRSEDEYIDNTFKLAQSKKYGAKPISMGFYHKVRSKLIDDTLEKPVYKDADYDFSESITSTTNEIVWAETKNNKGYLKIDADRFIALGGDFKDDYIEGKGFHAELYTKGAFTVVSLDELPIKKSSHILITAVNEFVNTSLSKKVFNGKKYIINEGEAPSKLSSLKGKLKLFLEGDKAPNVYNLGLNGLRVPIETEWNNNKNQDGELLIDIGMHDSPWYIIEIK